MWWQLLYISKNDSHWFQQKPGTSSPPFIKAIAPTKGLSCLGILPPIRELTTVCFFWKQALVFCFSAACKTSHWHLVSLQAGFHVWVLPLRQSAVTCENVIETLVCFEIKYWMLEHSRNTCRSRNNPGISNTSSCGHHVETKLLLRTKSCS